MLSKHVNECNFTKYVKKKEGGMGGGGGGGGRKRRETGLKKGRRKKNNNERLGRESDRDAERAQTQEASPESKQTGKISD